MTNKEGSHYTNTQTKTHNSGPLEAKHHLKSVEVSMHVASHPGHSYGLGVRL